jgi:hypothetical protein
MDQAFEQTAFMAYRRKFAVCSKDPLCHLLQHTEKIRMADQNNEATA